MITRVNHHTQPIPDVGSARFGQRTKNARPQRSLTMPRMLCAAVAHFMWHRTRRWTFIILCIVLSIVGSIVLCLLVYVIRKLFCSNNADDDYEEGTRSPPPPAPTSQPLQQQQQQPRVYVVQRGLDDDLQQQGCVPDVVLS